MGEFFNITISQFGCNSAKPMLKYITRIMSIKGGKYIPRLVEVILMTLSGNLKVIFRIDGGLYVRHAGSDD
jgi:hypothetical protein